MPELPEPLLPAGRADPLARGTGRRAELRRLRQEWLAERGPRVRRRASGRRWRMLALVVLGLSLLPATAAVSSRSRLDPGAISAATRFLCPNGGTLVPGRGGLCRPAHAPRMVYAGRGGWGSAAGWDAGLPAANRRQMECPEGTVPVPAVRGGATRCLPR